MKIIDSTISELNQLKPGEAVDVFNFVMTIKAKQTKRIEKMAGEHTSNSYRKVREALKNCSGSLSADIVGHREERI
jgi:tRNA A-37 threonylcarbamoyl transferase component Bud32